MSDVTNTESQAEAPQAAESISLNDLQVLLQIVDLSAERGAFKGPELSQIGAVRDKLGAFLESVAAAQEAANKAQEETSPSAAEGA